MERKVKSHSLIGVGRICISLLDVGYGGERGQYVVSSSKSIFVGQRGGRFGTEEVWYHDLAAK